MKILNTMAEIPYLYALCNSYILSYDQYSNADTIDGCGPVVRHENGVIFGRNYLWAIDGWQRNWAIDYNKFRYD